MDYKVVGGLNLPFAGIIPEKAGMMPVGMLGVFQLNHFIKNLKL